MKLLVIFTLSLTAHLSFADTESYLCGDHFKNYEITITDKKEGLMSDIRIFGDGKSETEFRKNLRTDYDEIDSIYMMDLDKPIGNKNWLYLDVSDLESIVLHFEESKDGLRLDCFIQ